jgi:hypothetical protein
MPSPLRQLTGSAVVIDISKPAANREYELSAPYVLAWEKKAWAHCAGSDRTGANRVGGISGPTGCAT